MDEAILKRTCIIVSPYILEELEETLVKDLHLSMRYARRTCRAVLRIAKLVELPLPPRRFVLADPDDDPIVMTALMGKAHYLVTADRHLLDLGKVQSVRIVNEDDFKRILDSEL